MHVITGTTLEVSFIELWSWRKCNTPRDCL